MLLVALSCFASSGTGARCPNRLLFGFSIVDVFRLVGCVGVVNGLVDVYGAVAANRLEAAALAGVAAAGGANRLLFACSAGETTKVLSFELESCLFSCGSLGGPNKLEDG